MNFVLKANAEGAILDAKWGSHIEGDGDVSFYPRPSVPGDGEVAGLIYPGAILVQLQRRLLLLPGNLETHFREPWERGHPACDIKERGQDALAPGMWLKPRLRGRLYR